MGKTTRPMLDPKLWRVEIAYVAYVMSDNHDDAIYKAKDGIRHEEAQPDEESAAEVTRGSVAATYLGEWAKSVPFGAEDDLTVAERVAKLP